MMSRSARPGPRARCRGAAPRRTAQARRYVLRGTRGRRGEAAALLCCARLVRREPRVAARRAHTGCLLHAPAWTQVWNRSADKCKDLVDGMRACARACRGGCGDARHVPESTPGASQRLLATDHTRWFAGHGPSSPSFCTAKLAQSKSRRRGSASRRATSPLRASRRQTCAWTSSLELTASSRARAPARATSTAALSTRRAPKRSGCATYP